MCRLTGFSFLSLFLLAVPLNLPAEGLPSLKQASEISTGAFPDGMKYYLVTNQSAKGFADFALVQKGNSDKEAIRKNLVSLPNFTGVRPYRFAASKGVGYIRPGYVQYPGNSAVYRFEGVPVFESAASDSTLLMLFDLAREFKGEQAVVISGDITAKALADRMYMLSLTVSARPKSPAAPAYVWKPSEKLEITHARNVAADVATIALTYRAPRTAAANMPTLIPLVSQMYAKVLADIITKRVEKAFYEAGLPLPAVSFRYVDSSLSPSDEEYFFSVSTSCRKMEAATSLLAGILSDLDTWGATADEFEDARDRLNSEANKEAGRKYVSNRSYVDKCVSAYLYGSNLAAPSTINGIFAGKVLSGDRQLELFNNFIAAVLDPDKALTIRYETPDETVPAERLGLAFHRSWSDASRNYHTEKHKISYGDTLSLYDTRAVRCKLKSSASEPVTGGQMWTFSNGIKVIYKNTGSTGEFNYALMLRGGFTGVPGLAAGESAFISDMLRLSDIAGMNAMDWRNMLGANGIRMDYDVSLSDLRVTGSAPSTKAQLLLKALVSLSNDRKVNRKTFEYYKSGEALRQELEKLTQKGINTVMDSIMCPDFFYTPTKSMRFLRDDLPQRAEEYFESQFSTVNDGVLILVGDLDETEIQKMLCKYLYGFRTGEKYSVRPKVQYQLRTGWSTYTVEGSRSEVGDGDPCVNVAMSAMMPFSMDKYMSFRIASAALRRSIVRSLADVGLFAELTERIEIFPKEKVTVFVNCRPCEAAGLPAGIRPADPLTALGVLRKAIVKACYTPVSAGDLNGYKSALLNHIASEITMPENLVNYALMRNAEGKDLISNYQNHVKAVTAASVQDILKQLDSACKIEYVIK